MAATDTGITQATNGVTTPISGLADPNAAKTFDPTKVNGGQITSTAQATQTQATLDPNNGLVQNQVNNIIGQNSPLMQRAAAKANQLANERGMLNSSMAVQAGQNAVLDAATPIAAADAGAYNSFAQYNAGQANQMGMFNAGEANKTATSNAGYVNQAGIAGTNAYNDILKTNANNAAAQALARENAGFTADAAKIKASADLGANINNTLLKAQDNYVNAINAINADKTLSQDEQKARRDEAKRQWSATYASSIAASAGATGLLDFSQLNNSIGGIQPTTPIPANGAGATTGVNTAGDAGVTAPTTGSTTTTSNTTGNAAAGNQNLTGKLTNAQMAILNNPNLTPEQKYMQMYPDTPAGYAARMWNISGKAEGKIWTGAVDANGNAIGYGSGAITPATSGKGSGVAPRPFNPRA